MLRVPQVVVSVTIYGNPKGSTKGPCGGGGGERDLFYPEGFRNTEYSNNLYALQLAISYHLS